jgi:hypothetical protein
MAYLSTLLMCGDAVTLLLLYLYMRTNSIIKHIPQRWGQVAVIINSMKMLDSIPRALVKEV